MNHSHGWMDHGWMDHGWTGPGMWILSVVGVLAVVLLVVTISKLTRK